MRRVERPRIEVVRVSSTERAKLLPLLEGGVQLQARFKHHLSNNYASCSSLDDTRAHLRYEGRRSSRRQQPLATKSCDNIYVGQLSGGPDERGPFMWQDTTRSEEQLCPDCHDTRCCTLPAGEATKSEGHINQITKMQAHNATHSGPEFSNKDLDSKNEQPSAHKAGRCNSEDSTSSDKSFAMTVRINKLRKQQALEKEVRQLEATTLAAPRIVIASPSPSATLRVMSDECKPPCRNSLTRGGDAGSVGSPLRPDSLKLLSGQLLNPALRLTPERVQHRMASLESIGSCSLDAEVTASEASECNEDSASERTLRSLSLLTKTPEAESPCKPVAGGASTPEYVKRTARLFETSTTAADHRSGVVNGKKSEHLDVNCEKITNGTGAVGKKPSYLGLACSISGYSGITTYDSKLREGFRSRDQSPGRLGLIASREVSPLRQGSDRTEGLTVLSECGNFLVPPTKGISRFVMGTPSSLSDGFLETQKLHALGDKLKQQRSDTSFVNGFEKFDSKGELCHIGVQKQDTGDKSTVTIPSDGYMKNGSSEMDQSKFIDDQIHRTTCKDRIPRESLSDTIATIRESSRHFMSSMLSSSSFSAISSEPSFNLPKTEELTIIQRNQNESSAKYSPDTPKNGSKDCLSAPLMSPLKRSPGAVRVVEFTSQTKSYVKTVSSNSTYVQTSASFSGQGTHSSATQETAVGSLSNGGNTSKSFVQQRVERLYGPGALVHGFFNRTKCLQRDADDQVSEDVPDAEVPVSTSSSSPALPVLRHLRPEFRAQLSVAVPLTCRPLEDFGSEGKVTVIHMHVEKSTEVPVLQQQVSVESVADLQPAAPEVVLPIDQCQVVPSQAEPDVAVSVKDGHFFLNLLKQELERLDILASVVEADLEKGQGLPEEVLGKLRATAGQARLLMKQKLQQFEGLCHKNLAQSSDEPFPTTSDDLAGFWDMVMLQVEQVNGLFAEIDELRANKWIEDKACRKVPPESSSGVASKRHLTPTKKATSKSANAETSKHAEAARKVREEARRKMMEQMRKAMRDKAAAVAMSVSEDVEIFVPLENGKHG